MAAPALLPDDATFRQLRQDHAPSWCPIAPYVGCDGTPHTYKEIGDGYGVSTGAAYQRAKRMDLIKKPISRHSELIPWRVSMEHIHGYPGAMLRLLSRRIKGQTNPARKEQQLDNWLAELEEADAVVTYDKDIEPNPASPKSGGWAYLKRQPEDGPFDPMAGTGIIRRPS